MKYVTIYWLDGSGKIHGGFHAGMYTKVVEAESFSEAVSKLKLGQDCLKLELLPVTEEL